LTAHVRKCAWGQEPVSLFWLLFFLIIVIVEIATIPMLYSRRPKIGGNLGVFAAVLNILQVIADQAHLMQPEVAPSGYLVLEDMVVLVSLILGFFSWQIAVAGKSSR